MQTLRNSLLQSLEPSQENSSRGISNQILEDALELLPKDRAVGFVYENYSHCLQKLADAYRYEFSFDDYSQEWQLTHRSTFGTVFTRFFEDIETAENSFLDHLLDDVCLIYVLRTIARIVSNQTIGDVLAPLSEVN